MLRLAIAFTALAWLAPDQQDEPTPRRCMLVIPPSQVAKAVYLELAYCMGGCDFYYPGWIVVAGPVACD